MPSSPHTLPPLLRHVYSYDSTPASCGAASIAALLLLIFFNSTRYDNPARKRPLRPPRALQIASREYLAHTLTSTVLPKYCFKPLIVAMPAGSQTYDDRRNKSILLSTSRIPRERDVYACLIVKKSLRESDLVCIAMNSTDRGPQGP